jgi:hypothetical protein
VAIISPDERTYCLNLGDTIAITLQFASPQPNKVWYRVVDGTHCSPAFAQNPFQAMATEVANSGGTYNGIPYQVVSNNHHNAHVLFWWIYPNEVGISFDKRDFSIAAPHSDSCSGLITFKARKKSTQEAKKQAKKKKGKGAKQGKGAKR